MSSMIDGRHLTELRKSRGLTQEELASISGLSRQSVCDLENDREANPTTSTLRRLARALRCSVGEIVDGPKASVRQAD
jgi:transcriptional regulator with XRE-family HTH domain